MQWKWFKLKTCVQENDSRRILFCIKIGRTWRQSDGICRQPTLGRHEICLSTKGIKLMHRKLLQGSCYCLADMHERVGLQIVTPQSGADRAVLVVWISRGVVEGGGHSHTLVLLGSWAPCTRVATRGKRHSKVSKIITKYIGHFLGSGLRSGQERSSKVKFRHIRPFSTLVHNAGVNRATALQKNAFALVPFFRRIDSFYVHSGLCPKKDGLASRWLNRYVTRYVGKNWQLTFYIEMLCYHNFWLIA